MLLETRNHQPATKSLGMRLNRVHNTLMGLAGLAAIAIAQGLEDLGKWQPSRTRSNPSSNARPTSMDLPPRPERSGAQRTSGIDRGPTF